jgi:hypothetical protein
MGLKYRYAALSVDGADIVTNPLSSKVTQSGKDSAEVILLVSFLGKSK